MEAINGDESSSELAKNALRLTKLKSESIGRERERGEHSESIHGLGVVGEGPSRHALWPAAMKLIGAHG